ncbi:OsmC family protein [Aquibacillus albus]|uniref:OsmC-like protein n=1 Tax=Aquibacillus albus TaxID=1168171 RepID=A0ABS2MXU2_9BACI|nr:OsmC family protein [Aquibacillus albus]MBM7570709.1 putative OsmC-like protein [Aquibacillus albus]
MVILTKTENGPFQIENEQGFAINGVTSKDATDGLTPFQLVCSSLSLCMAISIEALVQRDELKLDEMVIKVKTKKADDSPSRIERFTIDVNLQGEFDEKTKQKLVKSAKRACTIGNTIEQGAQMEINVVGS